MGEKLKDLLAGLVITGVFAMSYYSHLPIQAAVQFVAFFAVLFPAYLIGRRLFPKAGWPAATTCGVMLFFGIFSLLETAWFYAGKNLSAASDPWILLAAMALCYIITLCVPLVDEDTLKKHAPHTAREVFLSLVLVVCALVSAAYVMNGALQGAVLDSIRTPWPLLPAGTLLAIALTWCCVIFSAWLTDWPAFTAMLSAVALFCTTAIAPLLYKLGFGFDGFLHVASEKIILASGTLSPKPLYYLGQYVFTTWISRTANLPIEQVDRWLVPAGFALLVPLALYLGRRRNDLNILPALLILLPLAPFVATTPQAWSYLLGLVALLLARAASEDSVSPVAPFIFALWSAAAHPLSGIPFLFVVMALLLIPRMSDTTVSKLRNFAAWVCAILAACSVPLMFVILGLKSQTEIHWGWSALLAWSPWSALLGIFLPWIGNHYALWPSWSSLWAQSLPFVLLVAAGFSVRLTRQAQRQHVLILMVSACLMFVAWTVLKSAGDFAFLIDYERGNYTDRLSVLALMLLFLASLPSLQLLLQKMRSAPQLQAAAFAALLLAIAAATSYNALPRNDALVTGHGWSVCQADLAAVRAIDTDAAGQTYTVLADQSVSAAAVAEFGFKRYASDVFYYPIPTGGPLYDLFLRMTYNEPSRDTAWDAAKLGQSQLVYVVLDDYWWNYEYTSETLSGIAVQNWTFGDTSKGAGHSVKVYKFDLSKPAKQLTKTLGS